MRNPSTRVVFDVEKHLTCWAGEPVGETPGGSGVRCHIEHETLSAKGHGKSIASFCCQNYQDCPTWRAARDAYVAHREKNLAKEMLEGAR